MNDSKYIVFDGSKCAWPDFAVVFPNFIDHNLIRQKFANLEPLGAGFVFIIADDIQTRVVCN